jgi:hypothetical protein
MAKNGPLAICRFYYIIAATTGIKKRRTGVRLFYQERAPSNDNISYLAFVAGLVLPATGVVPGLAGNHSITGIFAAAL